MAKAQWSILRKHREARVGDLLLVATNGRVSTFGPARWAVFLTDGDERVLMAEGTVEGNEVGSGHRYQSFEREAMARAEEAAAAL